MRAGEAAARVMPSFFTQVTLLLAVKCASSVPTVPRLTLAEEWNSYHKSDHNGPGTYAFGYDIEDPKTGNVQYRQEEKYSNGTVIGSYGHLDPDGVVRITHYTADESGYRVKQENSAGRAIIFPAPDYSEENFHSNSIEVSPQLNSAVQYLQNAVSWEDRRTPPKYQDHRQTWGLAKNAIF